MECVFGVYAKVYWRNNRKQFSVIVALDYNLDMRKGSVLETTTYWSKVFETVVDVVNDSIRSDRELLGLSFK